MRLYQLDKKKRPKKELLYSTSEIYIISIIKYFVINMVNLQREREMLYLLDSYAVINEVECEQKIEIELCFENDEADSVNNISANCSVSRSNLINYILYIYSNERVGETLLQQNIFYR